MGKTMSTNRHEIEELFARLARVLDEGTVDDLRQIYAKDVLVRSPRGIELRGIDTVVDFLRDSAVDGELTQHVHGDILVSVDGERAEASANQLAYFYREGEPPHREAGLRLKYTAVRTDDGWRFDEANILRAWQREA
jgi:ketosteroid isomerase-like protein